MPVPISSGDRTILIAAGIVLVVMVAASLLVAAPQSGKAGYPSSYSAAYDGAKAAYLLLGELGYDVQRWESSPVGLPFNPQGIVLIFAEPWMGASADERQALQRFIRDGGTLLATGHYAADLLPEGGTVDLEDTPAGWQALPAILPSPLTRGAREIRMETPMRWHGGHFGQLGLYAKGEHAFVVTYRYGRGRVIWWAAPTPLTNAGISQPGNRALFLNVAGHPKEAKILWDEYFHGRRRTLWAYISGTPLPWALLQIALVAAALLFTFSRRGGPIRPAIPDSRLSPLEFVETLGALYHRAHAASAAVNVAYQRFRYLLIKRLGLPANSSFAQLHQAVRERLGWNQPGFFETLQAAERAAHDSTLTDARALLLVQALDHYARLFSLHPGPPDKENC
ncbi:MAG: DUF4350 domain-containing protein [Acidobacteria bacterium]|nr:DUF4350 domain-containing protein [Acidobacteriota bacterium]MBI3663038.1 DUF4350 domain-containing protein [Acidobacteriota bacterium]